MSSNLVVTSVGAAIITLAYYLSRSNDKDRFWYWLAGRNYAEKQLEQEVLADPDPALILNHSQYVKTNGHQLRIVHIIHELGSKVPLVVFIHGLGAQASQWIHQIEYFSTYSHVLAIDMLGCGKSDQDPSWSAYRSEEIVNDIRTLLETRYQSQSMVIIAHSFGCSIATYLAGSQSLSSCIKGLVLIAPKATIDEKQKKGIRILRWIPDWLFDGLRVADRKGGLESKSVSRMLGSTADKSLKRKQLRWNLMSRSAVYKRMVCGTSWPVSADYQKVTCPVLLIGAEKDNVVPANDAKIIEGYLLERRKMVNGSSTTSHPNVVEHYIVPDAGHQVMIVNPELVNPVITEFLIKKCGLETLSGAWQILNKTAGENKWDLKNYEKWKRTDIISFTNVGPSLFRAMKVMRQTDTDHSPSAFIAKHPEIGYIIDISKDAPPYRPSDFENSHISYKKLSTVSKIPPMKDDVDRFIKLASSCWQERPDIQIAVHCHYGFNRTGFFICCYMIERLGVSVPDALRFFEDARPPGIRHAHFKDELYLRYVLHKTPSS
ncbi:Alpha/Beta hydrolase protein [Umbelopsis sp. PMI_123]|nr:Alpha/Beta hydrolase protein [Umbelopsis sp. PMI_123]